jgi:hypothetical protein
MNASMDIEISKIPSAISVPARAIFTRNGKPVVFVNAKTGYQPIEVRILARNPDEVAIRGLQAGAMVALTDPEKQERKP